MGTSTGLSNALFSRVQSRVLGILFGQPDQEFQLSDIIARANSGRGAVQRELQKLTEAGIVTQDARGTRKLYHANRQSPIFNELHRLILKTVGMRDPIRSALEAHRRSIAIAFIYGSVAKGVDTARSDIDVMVIGDGLTYSEVYSSLQKAEAALGRPINPNLMSVNQWSNKVRDRESFASRVLRAPKLFVFGSKDELKALG